MRLLIDIGNSRIKWMCVATGQSISSQQLSHAFAHQNNFSTAIELCFGENSEFKQQLLGPNSCIESIIVSNVAGQAAAHALTEFALLHWQVNPIFAEVNKELAGIHNNYKVLSELGVDRWLAVIGARQYFPQGNVIVINCGTAITIDLLDAKDHFQGGTILPGFQLAARALSRADGIAKFEPAAIQKATGVTTQECVQLGVTAACVGGVEWVVDRIHSQLKVDQINILLSGGAAPLFLDASKLECEYDANVIMRGLNRIIECEF